MNQPLVDVNATRPVHCGLCGALATNTHEWSSDYGHLPVIGACDAHVEYLHGWARDMAHECECDSRSSARYDHQRDE